MMKVHALLLCMAFARPLPAKTKDKVIYLSTSEFNASGIFDISRIETGETGTHIYLHVRFIPG